MKEVNDHRYVSHSNESNAQNGVLLFAELIVQLGNTTKTSHKTQLLYNYISNAHKEDVVWLIALFTGRKPKRLISSKQMQEWCAELTQIPLWLLQECYHTVGDLAETIALLLPPPTQSHTGSLTICFEEMQQMQKVSDEEKKQWVYTYWTSLNAEAIFAFNKILTGGFRVGVSDKLLFQALAQYTGYNAASVAHMVSGNWNPANMSFTDLFNHSNANNDVSKPYPFYLAYPLEQPPEELGNIEDWQAEWKWDGIRGQLIVRGGQLFIWSRGEELITQQIPELHNLVHFLPDGTVLDGEIMCLQSQENEYGFAPLPFQLLQTRINRKLPLKKHLKEAPVGMVVYDVLEWNKADCRHLPLTERRQYLQKLIDDIRQQDLIAQLPIFASPIVTANSWKELATIRQNARENGSEGMMLKRCTSVYQTGRKSGDWWKWKIDPFTIDAVLVYAQKGHGRRSNLFTDYTFAVKNGDALVTFAKAYSGLTDKEFVEVDAFVKRNAIEKFGPVRTVKPQLVFEIAFEGIAASNRHKSGVALRFPRISRWRKDKTVDEINTLSDLKNLLHLFGNG